MSGEAGDGAPDDNPDLTGDVSSDTAPQPVSDYPDEDQEVIEAIAARERAGGGDLDDQAVEAMERPLWRLVGAAVLLEDIVSLADQTKSPTEELRSLGLMFLSDAIERDVKRIYRLYHGKRPG